MFSERVSGAKAEHPELDHFRNGDVMVVTKYGRLARSSRHCESYQRAGIRFSILGGESRHNNASRRADIPRLRFYRPF
ncbi:MAG: hypothetical protein ABJ139_06845 [Paracoccaceae bacterium]